MSTVKSWLGQTWFINLSVCLAGALFPFSLAPLQCWPLGLISQAWLAWIVLNNKQFGSWQGWLYGLGFFGVGLSWVYESIRTVGTAPVLSVLMTVIFCAALALLFALQFWLYQKLRNPRPSRNALLFTALWVLFEWLRSWFLTGLPWLYSGYSMTDTWLAGYAPIIGVFGLSSLTTIFATWIALLGVAPSYRKLAALIVMTLVILAGGFSLTGKTWVTVADQSLQVVALQGDIDQATKWDTNRQLVNYKIYRDMTVDNLDADLIVWPESAITRLLSQSGEMLADLDQLGTSSHTGIITGLIADEPASQGTVYFNSVIGLGLASGQYNKTRLVPFGEYIPFSHTLRGVLRILDIPMSALSPGHNNASTLQLQQWQLGQIICSEITYPDLVNRTASASNMLVIVSNDGWFGNSLGPYQHLQIVRMRAMETQRPMVRATQDGISAIVDYQGHVLSSAPKYVRTAIAHELHPVTGETPYMKLGYSWIIILWTAIVLWLLVEKVLSRRWQGSTESA